MNNKPAQADYAKYCAWFLCWWKCL